jgi:putative methyltransferase (TIGR04325 family)
MKKFFSRLFPSFLIKVWRASFTSRNISTYDSYEEAIDACQDDAYQNNELVKVIIAKNLAYKEKLQSDSTFDLGTLRTLIALGLSKTNNSLNVIDFGGGGGYHYAVASKALSNLDYLKWNVVETEAMVREAQRIAGKNLKFFDNIAEAAHDLKSVDLVFTSGALQYCRNPLAFLMELTKVNAKYLFITRTAFTNTESDIICLQESHLSTNGPGPLPTGYTDRKLKYPITYVSKSKAEEILKINYEILFTINEEKEAYSAGVKKIDMFGYFCFRKS